jgi:hypothetical protein
MTYQLTTGTSILRLSDNASIPPDPANRDFAEFTAWVEAGNTPDPAPTPVPPAPLTPAEKLVASGLTVSELKALLGLK